MLLVLSYCARDAALASQLLDYIQTLGPYDRHQCLLVHSPQGSQGLQKKAEKSFGSVSSLEVNVPDDAGWPRGPNAMFETAARYILESPEHVGSFFWCEPDCTPTHKGWLDSIEDEYFSAHQLFLGAVTPTRVMRSGVETEDGSHLMGCAVYPKDLAARSTLLPTLRHCAMPFDVYLRHEILPECHASGLIQHGWSTCGATQSKKGITLKPAKDLARTAHLRKDAVLFHGCKDASLINLLRKEQLQEAA